MRTNHFFKDLYDDRWGNPCNPSAAHQVPRQPVGEQGQRNVFGWVAALFRRRRDKPSAWSFTIPSDEADREDGTDNRCRSELNEPHLMALAKALSRNC
ncbi:hypothetical protein HGP17_16985 [Rhizobium sp. P38BS-XIX]|uniref:hypothetical protein n=1 Tax=Rhizobium sp. P38BS-XIX TaxID=2726740 RepID=UPI0014577CE7|nr:hypothetical protein [Rhizobium sp. P38BS-XIX]NLR98516.1 hypothetical protein [Rhizobium sp. P38BS-XIX]